MPWDRGSVRSGPRRHQSQKIEGLPPCHHCLPLSSSLCHLLAAPEIGPARGPLYFSWNVLTSDIHMTHSLFTYHLLLLLFPSMSLHSTYYLKSYPRYLSAYVFMSLSLLMECQLHESCLFSSSLHPQCLESCLALNA